MDNLYSMFGTNPDLESGAGVTLEYPGKVEITIHRAGGSNKKYVKTLAEKLKPHRQKYERGTLDEDLAHKLLIEAYAESIVIGWKNVKDKNGKKMEFTTKNVVKLFTDLPELFVDIQEQAANLANFRNDVEEIEEKNS